jgi:hypothetical protein
VRYIDENYLKCDFDQLLTWYNYWSVLFLLSAHFAISWHRQWFTEEELASTRGEAASKDELSLKNGSESVMNAIAYSSESVPQGSAMDSAMDYQDDNAEPVKERARRVARTQSTRSSSKVVDWDYDTLPVKIPIPPQLRKQLNDEHGFVNQSKELVPLPRIPSASDIMDNWAREYVSTSNASDLEVIDMLKTLFQDELGNHLLYRLERFQYAEFMSRNPLMSADKIYGAEHLLRLFVILPWFLSNAQLDEEVTHSIKIVVANLMEYMRLNMGTFFVQEYEPASHEALQDAGVA